MSYQDVYQRNYGLFLEEEQEKIRNSKIAIAGVGGVGGIQAATLARFGIGELSILDPGIFDEPDMNRQFGATKSNIGRNKAIAIGEMLKEINPFMKLNVFTQALNDQQSIEDFISDSAGAAALNGGLVATEAILILTGKRKHKNII
jgi:tRNA A37 threonylcarbamoyladenosine dehydratase